MSLKPGETDPGPGSLASPPRTPHSPTGISSHVFEAHLGRLFSVVTLIPRLRLALSLSTTSSSPLGCAALPSSSSSSSLPLILSAPVASGPASSPLAVSLALHLHRLLAHNRAVPQGAFALGRRHPPRTLPTSLAVSPSSASLRLSGCD